MAHRIRRYALATVAAAVTATSVASVATGASAATTSTAATDVIPTVVVDTVKIVSTTGAPNLGAMRLRLSDDTSIARSALVPVPTAVGVTINTSDTLRFTIGHHAGGTSTWRLTVVPDTNAYNAAPWVAQEVQDSLNTLLSRTFTTRTSAAFTQQLTQVSWQFNTVRFELRYRAFLNNTSQVVRSPRYRGTLSSVDVVDESGVDWIGSDETFVNVTMSNGSTTKTGSFYVSDGDSGETWNAGVCLSPLCRDGMSARTLVFSTQLVEKDLLTQEQARLVIEGAALFAEVVTAAESGKPVETPQWLKDYLVAALGDDLMGSKTIAYTAATLATRLPSVNSWFEDVVRVGEQGGDLPGFLDNPPDYDIHLNVTRTRDSIKIA